MHCIRALVAGVPLLNSCAGVSAAELVDCGFNMRPIDSHMEEPTSSCQQGLHINILEFLALTINVWFLVLKAALRQGPHPRGHILTLLTKNTSALSWLHHAARSHSPPVCRLARLISAFFLFNAFPLTLQGKHIPGHLNDEADCLSCFIPTPTLASVILQQPQLAICRPYHIPHKMLSALVKTLTVSKTEVLFATLTTKLLQLELLALPPGWETSASMTSC